MLMLGRKNGFDIKIPRTMYNVTVCTINRYSSVVLVLL